MEMSLTQTLWGSTENSCDSLDPGDVSSGSVRFFFWSDLSGSLRLSQHSCGISAVGCGWLPHGYAWTQKQKPFTNAQRLGTNSHPEPWMGTSHFMQHGWKWCHFRDFITDSKLKSWSQVQAFVFVDHWWLLQIEGFRVVSIVTWKDLLDRLFSCFDAGTNFEIPHPLATKCDSSSK